MAIFEEAEDGSIKAIYQNKTFDDIEEKIKAVRLLAGFNTSIMSDHVFLKQKERKIKKATTSVIRAGSRDISTVAQAPANDGDDNNWYKKLTFKDLLAENQQKIFLMESQEITQQSAEEYEDHCKIIFKTKCVNIVYDKKPCVALYMQDTLEIIG